mgnify:CR=1 FL=1
MMTKEFRRLNNITGWLVWAIATFTYCSTIEPTASFWDCGEYIACAMKLEVGHPPGAPFFLILGRVFAMFGGSDPAAGAKMINVMSALASSFTILFLFWTITRLAIKVYSRKVSNLTVPQQWAILGAGIVGSLAYTFSDSFWFSAVEGEVYEISTFFTAVVFWASLKWDDEDDTNPTSALRWLVFISYLIGVSIGVHLLNLLVIPSIGFIIYFKKYKFSWWGFVIAGLVSVLVLGLVQNLIIPKIVKFISDYEIFFTNKGGMPYNAGTIIFFLLLIFSLTTLIYYTISKKSLFYQLGFYSLILLSVLAVIAAPSASGKLTRVVMMGALVYSIHHFRNKTITLNAIFMSFATLLIGYSTFFILVIRSSANTPMDENDPENAPNMLSYLLREQYGDWPLLYGPYYNAPPLSRDKFGDADPMYAKDPATKKYKVVDDRKKSVTRYEKDFCTPFPRMWSSQSHHVTGYKYWGNVAENHRNIQVEGRDGSIETEEVPNFAANMRYFFKYQVNYMYWRYFFWNFVGRQNDIQGSVANNLDGNWVTGIAPFDNFMLDYDTSTPIYRDKNNFATNHYYALPLLLGLLGMFFHFQRNKPDAWIVLSFFFLTGLAIVIYLNQQPYQPRERDYAYTGSFYAFAVWIGFGVLFIYDQLSKRAATMSMSVSSTLLSLIVPGIMVKEGWNDHDRSLRTLSRDCAINYLQSCAPNAIIFTNGDNDTFPLWYAQEVEGIRTDVRVVNLSLLQTDWYIKQMRRAAYESKPVPFTIPEEKLEAEKMSYVILSPQTNEAMPLTEAMKYCVGDDPRTKYDTGNDLIDMLPSRKFYIDVDSATVMKNKVIDPREAARMSKRITWDLGGRNYIVKNDVMVLDLIAHNNWERPIYFAVTTGDEAYLGLKKYFQLEGLAYRFVPIEASEGEEAQGGRVNTDVMYDNIMNKFQWGGQDKEGVNMDENCTRMTGNLRMQMGILAAALIGEGKKDKARAVLDKCLEKMPEKNIPFDATIFAICVGYYEIGDIKKGNELSKMLFDIYEGDLRVYGNMPKSRASAYTRDVAQAKDIMRRLTGMAQQYKQDALYKEYASRLSVFISAEETEPRAQPTIP